MKEIGINYGDLRQVEKGGGLTSWKEILHSDEPPVGALEYQRGIQVIPIL